MEERHIEEYDNDAFWLKLKGKRVRNPFYGGGTIINIEHFNNPFFLFIKVKFDNIEEIKEFNNDSFKGNYLFLIDKIMMEVIKREIKELVHFTRTANLESILKYGLLGRNDCENINNRPEFNDNLRLNGYHEAICLSISFPNYKMFYSLRKEKYPNENRAVILLKPEILWEFDCAFFYSNASSKYFFNIPITETKKEQSFLNLFSNFDNIERSMLKIPDHYTTDPQAEVLVFQPIPSKYILNVHVNKEDIYREMLNNNNISKEDKVKFSISQKFFQPREDWEFWQKKYITPIYFP